MREAIRAAREHPPHLNQQVPSHSDNDKEKKGRKEKEKKRGTNAFSLLLTSSRLPGNQKYSPHPSPMGMKPRMPGAALARSGAAFLWLAAALATGIWAQGPGVVVSLGTCIYLSGATPEKLMAQEGREASRAASHFPLPVAARCIAALEKPVNNGPGSGADSELGFGRGARACRRWGKERRTEEREGGREG